MGKKHHKLQAAHAQAFQWKSHSTAPASVDLSLCETTADKEDSPQPVGQTTSDAVPQVPTDEPALDSDCEYTGGVNHKPDSDCWNPMEPPDLNNAKSLCEFNGNELKLNLAALQLSENTGKQEPKSNSWNDIFEMKSKRDWRKAEEKRTLGYNGHSDWTH